MSIELRSVANVPSAQLRPHLSPAHKPPAQPPQSDPSKAPSKDLRAQLDQAKQAQAQADDARKALESQRGTDPAKAKLLHKDCAAKDKAASDQWAALKAEVKQDLQEAAPAKREQLATAYKAADTDARFCKLVDQAAGEPADIPIARSGNAKADQSAQRVSSAYASGGDAAAAAQLKSELTAAASPQERQALIKSAAPVVDQLAKDIGHTSQLTDADWAGGSAAAAPAAGKYSTDPHNANPIDTRTEYDDTLSDLATSLNLAGDPAAATQAASQILKSMPGGPRPTSAAKADPLGRLNNTLPAGRGSQLTSAVATLLGQPGHQGPAGSSLAQRLGESIQRAKAQDPNHAATLTVQDWTDSRGVHHDGTVWHEVSQNPDLFLSDAQRTGIEKGARADGLSAKEVNVRKTAQAVDNLRGLYPDKNLDQVKEGDRLRYMDPMATKPPPEKNEGKAPPHKNDGKPSQGGGQDWMDIARGQMGQKEIAGARDNTRIVDYHKSTSLRAGDDETPWCSSFVNWTLERAGHRGTDSAAAISWKHWGNKVDGLGKAKEGDVVVLHQRGRPSSKGNHVAFFTGKGDGSVTLLGGNQSDQVKKSTYNLNEWEVVAVRRPPGAKGHEEASASPGVPHSKKDISDADYKAVAKSLDVDVAAIRAVADVESSGSGMLPSGKPKILFEAQKFHDQTGGQYDGSHPNLSSDSWNPSLYGAAGEHQWDRLNHASKLDKEAALKSASWGRFQILGSNYKRAGFDDVQSFAKAMQSNEGEHLRAFANFIKSDPKMMEALRNHDWAGFAKRYNGSQYAVNQYDKKMAAAYEKHVH